MTDSCCIVSRKVGLYSKWQLKYLLDIVGQYCFFCFNIFNHLRETKLLCVISCLCIMKSDVVDISSTID